MGGKLEPLQKALFQTRDAGCNQVGAATGSQGSRKVVARKISYHTQVNTQNNKSILAHRPGGGGRG
jgi:hypothetical protein